MSPKRAERLLEVAARVSTLEVEGGEFIVLLGAAAHAACALRKLSVFSLNSATLS